MWSRHRGRISPPRPSPQPALGSAKRSAETVAMIGTGNVGAALGQRFAEHGHTIVYGSRNPAEADVARARRSDGA